MLQSYLENQYYNDIQIDHYIDSGCFCNLCKNKRKKIFENAKNNIIINEKIIHEEEVKKYLVKKEKIFQEINKKIISDKKNTFIKKKFSLNSFL